MKLETDYDIHFWLLKRPN